ncbi:MAG: acyl-ACP--UDP-N-acetylglucosamine O-acyltransferase [Alphaproteobacteria bacterium]
MAQVHASAIVDTKAKLGDGVRIGPYCVIGAHVELGSDVVLHSHVVIDGRTRIGARSQIFPFASIGHRPQDLKYKGEPSELIVGEDTMVREHVTMNPGTEGGCMVTRVGDHCLFMMGAHVAHDCQIGDHVIMANNATLGGHVVVEDHAIIGGLSAIHQFVRIGRHAIVGGMSGVEHDVIPYGMAMGERARLHGLNVIGMKRHGFDRSQIQVLNSAYQILFADDDTLAERISRLDEKLGQTKGVTDIVAFVRSDSSRALCRPKPGDDR